MFYEIINNSPYELKWTTAVSIHSRSRLIDWSCPDCNTAASYPSGSFDVTIEGGKAYPDFLGCGAYPLLIVSRRVVDSWQLHGIGSFIKHPVRVAAALDTVLSPAAAPEYSRIEVTGDVKVDIPGSGGKITKYCTRCGKISTDPLVIKKFAFLERSWDGSPLFRDHRLYPNVIFCTDDVKQVAERERYTNCRFEEMIPTRCK